MRSSLLVLWTLGCRGGGGGGSITYDDSGDPDGGASIPLPSCETSGCSDITLPGYTADAVSDGADGLWLVLVGYADPFPMSGCETPAPTPNIYYPNGWVVHLRADGTCASADALGHAQGRLWATEDGSVWMAGTYYPTMTIAGETTPFGTAGVAGQFHARRAADGTWEGVDTSAVRPGPASVAGFAERDDGTIVAYLQVNEGQRVWGEPIPGSGTVRAERAAAGTWTFTPWAGPPVVGLVDAAPEVVTAGAGAVDGGPTFSHHLIATGESGFSVGATATEVNSSSLHAASDGRGGYAVAVGAVNPFSPMGPDAEIQFEGGPTLSSAWAWMRTAVATVDASGAVTSASLLPEEVLPWGFLTPPGGRPHLLIGDTAHANAACPWADGAVGACEPFTAERALFSEDGALWQIESDGYAYTTTLTRVAP